MFPPSIRMLLSIVTAVISIAIADPHLKAQAISAPPTQTQLRKGQESQGLAESVNPMRQSQVSADELNAAVARHSMDRALVAQITRPIAQDQHATPAAGMHSSSSHTETAQAFNSQSRTSELSPSVAGVVDAMSGNLGRQGYVTRPVEYVPHQATPLVRSGYQHMVNRDVQSGGGVLQNAQPAVAPVTFQQNQSPPTLNQNRTERDWLHHVNQLSAPVRERRSSSDKQTRGNSGESGESFIQREREAEQSKPSVSMVPTTRIAVNLAIVLAATIGVLLVVRHWQQGKGGKTGLGVPGNLSVVQVLPLAGGASLHVVDGYQKRVLLAIDATGIKSVDVIDASFDQSMHQMEAIGPSGATHSTFQAIADAAARNVTNGEKSNETPSDGSRKKDAATVGAVSSQRRRLRAERNRAESARTKDPRAEALEITPTPDIDQQLMELLLRNGSQAA